MSVAFDQKARAIRLRGLPVPPPANNLFFNVTGGGRSKSARYRAWRAACGWQVRLQNPARIKGPVIVEITIEDGGSRADLDNLTKGPLDLLCELQLIDGDHRECVRRVEIGWGAVEGMCIDVRPA